MRSVERTIEEVLLEAVGRPARARSPTARPSTSSPGGTRPAGWRRSSASRPRRPRAEGVMIFDASVPCDLDALHAQALELILRRAGLRTLSLDAGRRARPARPRAAARWSPRAVVLTGRRGLAGRDRPARLRGPQRGPQVEVFDYRGAVPDTGPSTVCRLGEMPGGGPRLRAGRAATRAAASGVAPGRRAAASSARRRAPRARGGSYNPPPMATPHRPVDPRASFPELEEGVLERWRERDVFPSRSAGARARPKWGFYEGPPTANGAPGTHHVLAGSSRTSSPATGRCAATTSSARAAGTATGCRSSWRSRPSSGMTSKEDIERIRDRRVQRPLPADGAQPRRGLEPAHRADRLLDRSRRRLPDARRRLHRVGVVGAEDDPRQGAAVREAQGGPLLPAVRHGAVEPRARAARRLPGRGRSVGLRAAARSPTAQRGRAARRRAAGVDDDAVDARLQRRGGGRPRPDLRPRPRTAAGRRDRRRGAGRARARGAARRSSSRFPGRALDGARYEPPFAFIPGSDYGPKGHTVLLADFVTAEDGTGLVHTAIAFGEDDFRLGEQYGLNVINPVRADGTYDERIGPYAGPLGQGRRPRPDRGPARARPAAASRDLRALLSALLAVRDAAALLRQAVLVHRHQRRSRTGCWPPTRPSTGIPSTSSTDASATGWRATSTGRCRASATGARRCPCGAARTATCR